MNDTSYEDGIPQRDDAAAETVVDHLVELKRDKIYALKRLRELNEKERDYLRDLGRLNGYETVMGIPVPLDRTAKEVYEKTIMFPISIGMCLVAVGSLVDLGFGSTYQLALGSFAALLSTAAGIAGLRSYLSRQPNKD